MISLEKWWILTPLHNLPKNVGDWVKLIIAKGFKKLPKVQKLAQSGHTDLDLPKLRNWKKFILMSQRAQKCENNAIFNQKYPKSVSCW